MSGERAAHPHGHLAGVGPGMVKKLLQCLPWAGFEHGHALGIIDHLADVAVARFRIELGVLGQILQYDMRHVQAADGVAVLFGARDFRKADDAARAGLVDEDPWLTGVLVPVLLHDAGLNVAGPASREGHDHVDGLVRIVRCGRRHGQKTRQPQSHEDA